MNTIPFGPRNPPEDPLLAKAAELPKEIEPAHDLWPGIAARLKEAPRESHSRSFGWTAALAAGFVVASVSALLTWGLMREPELATPPQVAAKSTPAMEIMMARPMNTRTNRTPRFTMKPPLRQSSL